MHQGHILPLPRKHQGFGSCAAQKQNLSSLCCCQNFATYKLSKRIQRVRPRVPKVGPAPRCGAEGLSHLSVQERTVPTVRCWPSPSLRGDAPRPWGEGQAVFSASPGPPFLCLCCSFCHRGGVSRPTPRCPHVNSLTAARVCYLLASCVNSHCNLEQIVSGWICC